MQTCYNCGKEVEDNVLICPECGALVKRYAAPERRQTQAEEPPQQARPIDPAPDAQTQSPSGSKTLWRDARGKLRLRGLMCAWLVICAVVALYNALAFGCGLYLYQNQQAIMDLFAPYGDASIQFRQMLELLGLMFDTIGRARAFFVLLLLVYLIKGASYIWFLAGKRRLALYIVFGASAVLYVMMVLGGSGFSALWYVADAIVTFLLLRRSWKQLPR